MASHASNSKSALSPARQRNGSTSHRGRPTPGTGSGVDGSAETRHRDIAAVGWPKSDASVCRLQRRSAIPIVPDPSAASWSRREVVMEVWPPPPPLRQTPVTQPFLKAGEHGLLVAGFEINDPVEVQTSLRERRRK